MAWRIDWSPEALEDLEQIAAYLERDSPWYAKAVVGRIVEDAETLDEFPLRGRVVPELDDPAFRERFCYRYRLIYRVEPDRILIAAVIHGARDPMSISNRLQDEPEQS